MAWFKVDDGLWGHPKWLTVPSRARGLWVSAGSWCARQENDGAVPRGALRILDGRPVDAGALVAAGLWLTTDDGWRFHDWTIYQPDADTLAAEREAQSDAGVRGNHKRWHAARGVSVPSCPLCSHDEPPDAGPDRDPSRHPIRYPIGSASPVPVPDTRPDIRSPLSVVQSGSHQTQIVTTSTRATASLGLGGETR